MGRFGKFLACSNYPECKTTHPLFTTKEEQAAQDTGEKCPNCGASLIVKTGRFGKFLACSGYPKCKFTKQIQKGTGLTCPQCKKGEIVVKKSKRGKIFWACNRYPDCNYATWENPAKKEEEN